jgi:hypothetical protein
MDQEWKISLDWIETFCHMHKCTKFAFLRFFQFPMGYYRFLYYEVPSVRKFPCAIGYEFRQRVNDLSMDRNYDNPGIDVFNPIQDQIQDLFMKNLKTWRWDIRLNIDETEMNSIFIRYNSAEQGCLEKFLNFLSNSIPETKSFPLIIYKSNATKPMVPTFITTEFEYW